jgi:probable HAF family extracellular repeat protein
MSGGETRRGSRVALVALAAAAVLALPAVASAADWTPIGDPSEELQATAVNAAGDIAGIADQDTSPSADHRAFVYKDGQFHWVAGDVCTDPNDPSGASCFLQYAGANAVNASDEVAGFGTFSCWVNDPAGPPSVCQDRTYDQQALFYGQVPGQRNSGDEVWDVANFSSTTISNSTATGLSDGGVVVGNFTGPPDFDAQAFVWGPGAGFYALSAPSGMTDPQAAGISPNGETIAGWADGPDGRRAVAWTGHCSTTCTYSAQNLGVLRSDNLGGSEALAANDSGEVVGWSDTVDGTRAFVESGGTMTNLGAIPTPDSSESEATAINAAGQVVGWSLDETDRTCPVLFNTGGNPLDFCGDVDAKAVGISDAGEIAISAPRSGHAYFVQLPSGTTAQITPSTATCTQFADGDAESLPAVQYTLGGSTIKKAAPTGFFYWVKVTAPAGSNTFTVSQAITTGNFGKQFELANGNVYTSSCEKGQHPTIGQAPSGDSTVDWTARTAGTYFISLRFKPASLAGQTAPDPSTVHFVFSTGGVAGSAASLDVVPATSGASPLKRSLLAVLAPAARRLFR